MDQPRVNYDQLSPTYHSRYDKGQLDGIAKALLQIARQNSAQFILEVGCGTGRWVETLRASGASGASVLGADASTGMLSEARARLGSNGLMAAHANHLPFASRHFDLICCVNAVHHFDDPQAFVSQAAALLRPGGILAVIGIDPRAIRHRYLYDYFSETREMDLRRYPSFGELVDWTIAAGLHEVELGIVETAIMTFSGRAVFQDPFLQKASNSTLALLTDATYEAGLRRIERAIDAAEASGESVTFRSELAFGMISGCYGVKA